MLKEPSTFETSEVDNAAAIPSLTICPRQYKLDEFTKIEDVMEEIKETKKGTFEGLIKREGKGTKKESWSLTNTSVLSNVFNKTLEDIWTFSAIIEPTFQNSIIVCATLNVPIIDPPTQGYYIVSG